LRPDVVHFQHEESLFGQGRRFLRVLDEVRALGAHVVVTLHTVYAGLRGRGFHRELSRRCDRVVAHQEHGMAAVLAMHGVPVQGIDVIAHGTPLLPITSQAVAREALGVPGEHRVALFFGFIHYGKGLHYALAGFERALRTHPDARFVIAGRVRRSHVLDTLYSRWLERRLRPLVVSGHVVYRPGFVPVEQKPLYYSAADVVVLPHVQSYGSASGVLHEALAAGKPILCTRGKKFAEAVEAFAQQMPQAFPPPRDVGGWQAAFEQMLGSDELRQRAGGLVSALGAQTSWSASARRHLESYERAIAAT
jgi:glycosyltransferase involved in cell wall biosynthesis